MTPHQTARWSNAVAIANRINALLDEGYLVFDEHQQPVRRFTITDTMIQSGSTVYAGTEEGWDGTMFCMRPWRSTRQLEILTVLKGQ
jgi:hypothetical protein